MTDTAARESNGRANHAPDSLELLPLQEPQDLGLHQGRHVADLVQEEFAEKEALSESTLFRVKRELQIRRQRIALAGKRVSYWLLPNQELPEDVRASVLFWTRS